MSSFDWNEIWSNWPYLAHGLQYTVQVTLIGTVGGILLGDPSLEFGDFLAGTLAVGIEGVGYVTGRSLAQRFGTIDRLLAATPEDIAQTPGVGPKTAQLIHDQLADPQMRELFEDLRGLGLTLEQEGPPPGEGRPSCSRWAVLSSWKPYGAWSSQPRWPPPR